LSGAIPLGSIRDVLQVLHFFSRFVSCFSPGTARRRWLHPFSSSSSSAVSRRQRTAAVCSSALAAAAAAVVLGVLCPVGE
jgi:hypothetical protein